MITTESSFQVISLKEDHTCVRDFKYGNLVNYKWFAKHFGHKIRQNPEIKLHEIADLVLKKYKWIVSQSQCRYAKTKALNEGDLTIQEHYALIRSYGKEILDSNDGSTVKLGVTVNPDDKTYFDRFYCCLYALKKGFKLGCRPVIALDGCFLKKPHVGATRANVGLGVRKVTSDGSTVARSGSTSSARGRGRGRGKGRGRGRQTLSVRYASLGIAGWNTTNSRRWKECRR
ncbi:hypothetical protein Tco_1314537 [Tanacetum coccineum]